MKYFHLLIATVLLGFGQLAHASMKVTVNGMVCSFCEIGRAHV